MLPPGRGSGDAAAILPSTVWLGCLNCSLAQRLDPPPHICLTREDGGGGGCCCQQREDGGFLCPTPGLGSGVALAEDATSAGALKSTSLLGCSIPLGLLLLD